MPKSPANDHRKNSRYETEVKVYFHFPYELQTKVDYQIKAKEQQGGSSPLYTGISRNVSAEGICFNSSQQLTKNDHLIIELHLPGDNANVMMEGKVRWCLKSKDGKGFDTGVQLVIVNGKSIAESIYFDETYQIEWSALLEAVLGKFRILSQDRKKK